ncbi:uncharacterized protein CXorf49-like [Tamandua tetradactyla]|uniref:uncharacterized protein CXorf49-like n=1 Tax=Tamandua tetradactyla TaxID=48850 RepID=UPI004054927C
MSSPDEVSVRGADLGPEGLKQGPGRDLDVRAPQSGEGEGGLLVPEGLQAEQEVIEATGSMPWGLEGRPGSPADEKEDTLDYTPQLAEESVAVAKQLTDQDTPEVQRNPSCENRAFQMSSIWADLDKSSNGRSTSSPSSEKSQQASPRGRAWGKPRRGPKSGLNIPVDLQQPSKKGMVGLPSDPESSDDFSEIQLMRVHIYPKGGRQAKFSSPEDPRDAPRRLNRQVRETLFPRPGSFQVATPRGFTSAIDQQPVGELEVSSKKMPIVVSGKQGNKPNYVGAAATSGLPHATTKKKVAQVKKSSSGTSKAALGKKYQAFPTFGQRVSGGSLAPPTFPPISGLPLLGRSKRSLVHSATKQPTYSNSGKKPVSYRSREYQLVSGEENDLNRDPVPKGQRPSNWPELSSLSMRRGEFSSRDPKTRNPQVPGSSQPLALIQGGINPRGPTSRGPILGHQEPLDLSSRHERQQQPPEAQDCPGCLMRQKEIDDLKHQLAVLQSLTDEFQAL